MVAFESVTLRLKWNTGAESIFLAAVSAAYAAVARKQTMSSLKVSTIPRL